MKKLCLESNENDNELIVKGDIDSIFRNRRAARFLKDTVSYKQMNNSLVINVEDDINTTIGRIKKYVNTFWQSWNILGKYLKQLINMHWKRRSLMSFRIKRD